MLARQLPGVIVAVGRRRDVVGRWVEERFGPCVSVLDDGFQHLRLARDIDILCLRAADLADAPLPAGRLREAPGARARADILLVEEAEPSLDSALLRDARAFAVGRRVLGFFDRWGVPAAPPSRPTLLAAIARPERFASDVRSRGVEVTQTVFLRDHHRFTVDELRRVAARARASGADALVTTAKDVARLPAVDLELPLLVFMIAAAIADEARFGARLAARLAESR
jgi:tetraacyldisaccharide 4'-kinase